MFKLVNLLCVQRTHRVDISCGAMKSILLKTGPRRGDVSQDENNNIVFRVYFFKDDLLKNEVETYVGDSEMLTPAALARIQFCVTAFYKSFAEYLGEKGMNVPSPSKGQLYFNPGDDYYSVVLLFRVSRPRAVVINELR
jgi:hypothetical protein